MLSVINVDVEFALNRIVHLNASAHIKLTNLCVPVSLESNRHAFPAVRVNVSQSVSAHLDDALGQNVGLLIQVHVVLPGVVE